MDDSKFINRATIEYLDNKAGVVTPLLRLENLESVLNDLQTFLQDQQKFLGEYENYVDQQVSNLTTQIDFIKSEQAALSKNNRMLAAEAIGFITELEFQKNFLKRVNIISIISAGVAIGMGASLWLVK